MAIEEFGGEFKSGGKNESPAADDDADDEKVEDESDDALGTLQVHFRRELSI